MSDTRIPITTCPVCGGSKFLHVRDVAAYAVQRCSACQLQLTNPQPSDAELGLIYGSDYFLGADDPAAATHASELKRATADHYLDVIARLAAPPGQRLLEVGSGHGDFLERAVARGFDCTGIEYSDHACTTIRTRVGTKATVICGEIDAVADQPGNFDLCVLNDVIEHVRRPAEFLQRVRDTLAPGGVVFVATPSVDSWSARLLRSHWMEYKAEHLTYFGRSTLRRILENTGFRVLHVRSGAKILSIDYVTDHFVRYPVRLVTPVARMVRAVTPASWRRKGWRVVASGILALARKAS